MYEKYGLMVRITNPEVIAYLRSNQNASNKQLIETALREKIGLPPKTYHTQTRKKEPSCANAMPVKIGDQELVDYIVFQHQRYGILQKHIVESAILEKIEREKK